MKAIDRSLSRPDFRGSRKHVLDWTSQPRAIVELLGLVQPVRCKLTHSSVWMPLGYSDPTEARLESFGKRCMPDHAAWSVLTSWWLKHPRGANTPNWDLAVSCEVEGAPGLILVEAKANVPELSAAGKRRTDPAAASDEINRGAENHEHIGAAIEQVREAMRSCVPGLMIGRDTHYQLSNRIAFGWQLASFGIPTVLLYLGFTGDTGIQDVGEPFVDDAHWQRTFAEYLRGVCPEPSEVLGSPLASPKERLWVLSRSRPVIETSRPRHSPKIE